MTRFDASAWAGQWPFTMSGPATLQGLVASLQPVGITGAAVSPLAAVLGPEPMAGNLALIAEACDLPAGFTVRVVPIIDPSLPGWQRDLDDLLSRYADRIGAIRVVPNYHGYAVDGPQAITAARLVADVGLGLCVQVRMLDERAHHPLMKVPGVPADGLQRLAATVPGARILACGAYQSDLAAIANAANVAVELSSVESGDTVANATAIVGTDRLMLGTHAPIYMPAPALAKVAVLDHEAAARIGDLNARAFFR